MFAYLSYTPFRTLHTFHMSNGISSVAWSPDSRVFAAVTWGEHTGNNIAMVSVWRASDGRQLYTYIYPSAPLYSSRLAWSPDGSSFAIAWDDGNVQIWGAANDYSSWQEKSSFHIHVHASVNLNLYLTGLAWSADGKHLVMSYSDGELHVWDTVGGHPLPPVQAPVALRTFLSLSPDGSGAIVPAILSLSPDGTQAIVPGQQTSGNHATYAVWEVGTGKVMALPSQNVIQVAPQTQFAWAPDGHSLAATYGIHVIIRQWNPQRKNWAFVRSVAVVPFERGILALAWAPDNQHFAVADSSNVIRLWSVKSGKLLGPQFPPFFDHPASKNEIYSDTENTITTLAWSPNGKYLLSGNYPGRVLLQEVY